jgi:hypothetical protein
MFSRRRTVTTAPTSDAVPVDDPYYANRTTVVRRSHTSALAGGTATGAGAGFRILARVIMAVGVLIALLIGLAILLRDVGANPHNDIVNGLHDAANFFAGSFTGLVNESGHAKRAISINWGIAAVVYLLVGALLASAMNRIGRSATSYGGRTTPPTVVASH